MALDQTLPKRPAVSRKMVVGLLALGMAWMWWNALSKNKGAPSPAARATVPARNTAQADAQASIKLPANIERQTLENAERDPFAIVLPPQPQTVAVKKPVLPPVAPPPAFTPAPMAVAAPSPPALNLRFVGQATTPEGERMVYAQLGQETVLLLKGTQLSNGYQVISIEAKSVNLLFAPLNHSAQMLLPDPPPYEIR